MRSNKVIRLQKTHQAKPTVNAKRDMTPKYATLKWLFDIASKETPDGTKARKVLKLIENMSRMLQKQLIEDLKAESEHLIVALAEVAKFPLVGAEARLGLKLIETSSAVAAFLKDTSLHLPFATRRFKADVEAIFVSMKKQCVGSKYIPISPERRGALQFPAPHPISKVSTDGDHQKLH